MNSWSRLCCPSFTSVLPVEEGLLVPELPEPGRSAAPRCRWRSAGCSRLSVAEVAAVDLQALTLNVPPSQPNAFWVSSPSSSGSCRRRRRRLHAAGRRCRTPRWSPAGPGRCRHWPSVVRRPPASPSSVSRVQRLVMNPAPPGRAPAPATLPGRCLRRRYCRRLRARLGAASESHGQWQRRMPLSRRNGRRMLRLRTTGVSLC